MRTPRPLQAIASTLLFLAATSNAWAAIQVFPLLPTAFEPVRVVVPNAGIAELLDLGATRIQMQGNRIEVELVHGTGLPITSAPWLTPDLMIGAFPAGEYEVVVRSRRRDQSAAEAEELGRTTFVVRPQFEEVAPGNWTDIWYAPKEPGWGINLVHHTATGKIFATWFVYGPDNQPTWYVVSDGTWSKQNGGSYYYVGKVYRASGPPYTQCLTTTNCTVDFPGQVSLKEAGTMTLNFSAGDSQMARLRFSIDGQVFYKEIVRQSF